MRIALIATTLITVMGIEKLLPTFTDPEVFLQFEGTGLRGAAELCAQGPQVAGST